jgi:hypothetical protein
MRLQMKNSVQTACFSLLLLLVANSFAFADESDMPPTCKNYSGINDATLKRIVAVAFEEAKRKRISLKRYHSVFAVFLRDITDGNNKVIKKGGYFGVRFSPYVCDDLSTDGGGFDVDIDPKSFKVIASRKSFL